MISYTRRTTCRSCDSLLLEAVMSCEPTPCGNHYVPALRAGEVQPRYAMDVALCLDCGLAKLPDVVNPAGGLCGETQLPPPRRDSPRSGAGARVGGSAATGIAAV